jgi:adenylosuccinate lyase
MLETFLTIMEQIEIFPSVIEKENRHYFPFLSTTTILMEAVKKGTPREKAHAAIKEHAIATVRDLRNGVIEENDLLQRLADDERLDLSIDELQKIISKADKLIGNAKEQIKIFSAEVAKHKEKFPEAESYTPGKIL